MEDGAFHESFRQPIRIRIQSDFNGVSFDESSVVICDVERLSIRQTKPERPEWLAVHPVFDLLRIKHMFQRQTCVKRTRKSTPAASFQILPEAGREPFRGARAPSRVAVGALADCFPCKTKRLFRRGCGRIFRTSKISKYWKGTT